METLFFRIGVLLGLIAVAVVVALPLRHQFADFHELVRRTSPPQRALLALLAAVFIAYGGSKTNEVDQAGGTNEVEMAAPSSLTSSSPSPLAFTSAIPTVTPEDIARGWRFWEVRTNDDVCYTMPEGAMMASNWWVRGAYDDVTLVDLGGAHGVRPLPWRFPFGTNGCSSLWAFSWGKVRFALADTNAEIVAVGAPMSAVPYRSRLWSAADANGSRFVTWEAFALNRDTNTPVNAQVEFCPGGDFVTRSNEVETVYRHIDPEDWDGDGWRNEDDYDPYVWEDSDDYFDQDLPEGADESAYCWVEVRPRWNSYIEFVGDGPSDLDDPYLWAKAGETYRVRLLIGKTYEVGGSQPLEVVAKSDERVEVSDVGSNSFTVVWPVGFTVAEGRAPAGRPSLGATWNDGGKSFYVMPDPPWLRGEITWTNEVCCEVWGDGTNFTYACDNDCTCAGCTVYGSYRYEGYALPVWGIPCGCRYVPDEGPADVSVSFDRPVVIYEDDYTNLPGVVVHPARSNAVLRCTVAGGTYGGRLTVSLNGKGRRTLSRVRGDSLPNGTRIQAGVCRAFETEYAVLAPSDSEDDIVATATFVEDFLDETHTDDAEMTSVKVEISPEERPPENLSPNRHLLGVQEKVYYHFWPETAEVVLSDGNRGRDIFIDDYERCFYCPWTGGVYAVSIECASQNYDIPLTVIEPGVECIGARWNESLDANAVEGSSGWVGMVLLLYLTPRTVAFQRISMVEIPVLESDAHELAPDDYFALMPDVLTKTHDSRAGAGRWKMPQLIGNGYYWTGDFAQMPRECPPLTNRLERVWSQGLMRWDIPIGWGEPNVVRGSMRQNPTEQVYEIEPDGTLTIRKYQHWIKRDISGRVWLDGSRVNAWWSDLW